VYVELLGKVEKDALEKGRELELDAMKEKAAMEKERDELERAAAQKKSESGKDEDSPSSMTEASEKSEEELLKKTVALDLEEAEDPSPAWKGIAPKVLRIGVSSEMGRDRSVAFVEELGRKKWPVEWAVEILHRDVDKQRGLRKGKARGWEKGGRRKSLRGGEFVNGE